MNKKELFQKIETTLELWVDSDGDNISGLYDCIYIIVKEQQWKYHKNYTSSGAWSDEEFEDLTQTLIIKLIDKGTLKKYYFEGRDGSGIYNGISLILRNHLIDRFGETHPGSGILFRKIKQILEKDSRFNEYSDEINNKHRRYNEWGLANWNKPEPYNGNSEELLDIGNIEGASTKPKVLAELIEKIFQQTNEKTLSTDDLKSTLEQLLNVSDDSPTNNYDLNNHPDNKDEQIYISIKEIADNLFDCLSHEEKTLIYDYYINKDTLEKISEREGCSIAKVSGDLSKTAEKIKTFIGVEDFNEEEIKELLSELINILLES
jgi:RNA polymerase sigma factor (sigma-70 family)